LKAFDLIAREWDKHRTTPSPILPYFLEMIPAKGVSLDAGCGNGRNLVEIARKSSFTYGVDSSAEMLKHAEKRVQEAGVASRVKLFNANVSDMPIETGSIDSAFYLAVLHHLRTASAREKAFKEMHRVLRLTGAAFLTVWNKHQPKFSELLQNGKNDCFVAWKLGDGKVVKRFYHFFDETELRELAEKTGFRSVEFFCEKKQGKLHSKEGANNLCMILRKS
jgi:ubiquinone/menaquinone biosynthesis C-methylase UbiE